MTAAWVEAAVFIPFIPTEKESSMKRYAPLLALVLLAGCDKDKPGTTETTGALTPANNTKLNGRDNGTTLTPIDQSNSADDLATVAQVRKALMADDTLSMDAKNVKVIVSDGAITLRGPVKTDEERKTVERTTMQLAGSNRVESQLEVER
jgi:hyperosmotically inducible periplasmic protein